MVTLEELHAVMKIVKLKNFMINAEKLQGFALKNVDAKENLPIEPAELQNLNVLIQVVNLVV